MYYQLQIRFEPDFQKRKRMEKTESAGKRNNKGFPAESALKPENQTAEKNYIQTDIPSKSEELILICKKLKERFSKYNAEFKIIDEDGIVSNSFEIAPWGNLESWWDDFFDSNYIYEAMMLNQQKDLFSWRFENGKCTECLKVEVKSCKPEIIRPEKALKWLKKSPENESYRNRDLICSHVEELCNEMKAGRWNDRADPVEVLENGVVLNGQHRLNAVVMADIPVSMNIRTYRKSEDLFF